MAQATSYQSPDVSEQQEEGVKTEQPTTEKKSVFGKLKEKTKNTTSHLKQKLKPGAGGGDAAAEDTSSSSSSEDESEIPTNNAFSGMTQAEYERKLKSGEVSPITNDSESLYKNTASHVAVEDFNQRTPNEFPSSQGQESALASQFEGLSTEDKPSSQMDVADETLSKDSGRNTPADSAATGTTAMDNILEKAGDPHADVSDVAKDKADPEGLLSGKTPAEPSKTWGQWVGEKVGLAKPSSPTAADTTTSATTASDKPITEKIREAAIGAKDSVVGSTKATAEETKEGATHPPSDSSKQTYTQKLTGAIYGAKDSLMSSTHPGDEDKALSQKVTETVSNLPTTIKSTLGFGGSKSGSAGPTTTSPTTTPRLGVDTPSTEESEHALPQSPGIVSRITGSVTSLFGKKQQTDSPATAERGTPTPEVPTSEATSETTITTS